jgi:hypothetical protein
MSNVHRDLHEDPEPVKKLTPEEKIQATSMYKRALEQARQNKINIVKHMNNHQFKRLKLPYAP